MPSDWEKRCCVFSGRSRTFCRPQDLQYDCRCSTWPKELNEKWMTLQRDEATNSFLKRCLAGPTYWEMCQLAPLRVLRWFVSATDADAILNRGETQLNSCRLFLVCTVVLSSSRLESKYSPSRLTLNLVKSRFIAHWQWHFSNYQASLNLAQVSQVLLPKFFVLSVASRWNFRRCLFSAPSNACSSSKAIGAERCWTSARARGISPVNWRRPLIRTGKWGENMWGSHMLIFGCPW